MRFRVALYSHDTQGLGHARRNLNLARSLIDRSPDADILLICGTPHVAGLDVPGTIDTIILPQVRKDVRGSYRSKVRGRSLEETIKLRTSILSATLSSFQPDVLIVDKHPFGLLGELKPAITLLRGTPTKMILGIRDVLDDPEVARAEWEQSGGLAALRDNYETIWVYGDKNVHDPTAAFALAEELRTKIVFTGYLNPLDSAHANYDLSSHHPALKGIGKYCLCLLGGGQDGFGLANLFIQADYGGGQCGVLVLGPFMDESSRDFLKSKAKKRSDLLILDFASPMLPIIAHAERVVSLGGYNSTCEILALGKPALIIPRTSPRIEQLIRAQRLCELGLLDTIRPEHLDVETLSGWLSGSHRQHAEKKAASLALDFGGFGRVSELVHEIQSKSDPIVHY